MIDAAELHAPVVAGSSMGGRAALDLALEGHQGYLSAITHFIAEIETAERAARQ